MVHEIMCCIILAELFSERDTEDLVQHTTGGLLSLYLMC